MKLLTDLSVTARRHRPAAAPALLLDFARQAYRAAGVPVPLSSVLNFSRASAAVRGTAGGLLETVGPDVLRLDHAFGSGAFRGALFEPQATNLLSHSSDFTQNAWSGYAAKPAFTGGQGAPDGSLTAMTWNCSATTGGAGGQRGGILVVGGSVSGVATASVWLRASAPLGMRFGHSDGTSKAITVTPEWQRFSYTDVLPNTQNRIFMLYEDVNADTDVFIWGAQVELGGSASSYISTGASPAARSADQPGLTGISGTFDVTITYDDDSQDKLAGETVSEGWWPALSRPWVKKLVVG